MARGQQKIQSQQKAAKRAQDLKRQQGHDQKTAAQKALQVQCCICKVSNFYTLSSDPSLIYVKWFCHLLIPIQTQMPDPKTYKQHFENKHPKAPLPAELQAVTAWRCWLTSKIPIKDQRCIKNSNNDHHTAFQKINHPILKIIEELQVLFDKNSNKIQHSPRWPPVYMGFVFRTSQDRWCGRVDHKSVNSLYQAYILSSLLQLQASPYGRDCFWW